MFQNRENHHEAKTYCSRPKPPVHIKTQHAAEPETRIAAIGASKRLETEFLPLFSAGAGHPPLPIRLACGLMILQQMFNVSDEKVVEVWVENPYWQAFCGYDFLQWKLPAHLTSLTHWRNRLGAQGVEKLLQLSISVALRTKTVTPTELSKVISDTTVMPKAVTHPVDAKLIRRSIERIVRAAKAAGIHLKRTFDRVATWALKDYLRLMHGKKMRKAQKPFVKRHQKVTHQRH